MRPLPTLVYEAAMQPRSVRAALIWAFDVSECLKPPSAPPYLADLLARVRAAGELHLPAARKAAVRGMLRYGSYKPSGRSKPSSEYLLAAALEGSFPLVNGPVDVNNAVSLESGYPASIFDMDLCGVSLLMRRGAAGESYVFNPAGQGIDLRDLLCVCRAVGPGWEPCGNPVKDSMATKIHAATRNVVAVLYAPMADPERDLEKAAARFSSLLRAECGSAASGWAIV